MLALEDIKGPFKLTAPRIAYLSAETNCAWNCSSRSCSGSSGSLASPNLASTVCSSCSPSGRSASTCVCR